MAVLVDWVLEDLAASTLYMTGSHLKTLLLPTLSASYMTDSESKFWSTNFDNWQHKYVDHSRMNFSRSGKRRAAKAVNIVDDQSQASLRREVQVSLNATNNSLQCEDETCFESPTKRSFVLFNELVYCLCHDHHHQVLWELRTAGSTHTLHLVDYFEQGTQVSICILYHLWFI